MNDREVCKQAIVKFGPQSQIDMCIEECSELINALEKYRRGRNTKEDVITEIADVQIMCEQMQELFGTIAVAVERDRKIRRLIERIEKPEPARTANSGDNNTKKNL